MKRHLKFLMAIGLCSMLLLGSKGPLLAADDKTAVEAKTYSLEEIRTLSGIHGAGVMTQKAANDITDADKFNAEMNYYDALYASSIGTPGADARLKAARLAYDSAIENQESAADAIKETQRQAEYDGESRYFAYQEMETSLGQIDKSLAVQEESLRVEKAKLQLGLSTQLAVDKLNAQINELKNNVTAMQNAKTMASFALMNQIGQPEDSAFWLAAVTEYPALKEKYDRRALVETAFANSLTLKQLDRAIEDLDDKIDDGGLPYTQREQMAAQANKLKLSRKQFNYTLKLLAESDIKAVASAQANLELLQG